MSVLAALLVAALGQQQHRINFSPPNRTESILILLPPAIDIWVDQEPIDSVLRRADRHYGYRIARTDVKLSGRVSARLLNVPIETALNQVLLPLGARATLVREKPYLIIDQAWQLTFPKLAGKRLSFDFDKIDIRQALRLWAKEVGEEYTVSTDISCEVTVKLRNVTAEQALRQITHSLGIGVRAEGGILNFVVAEKPALRFTEAPLANPIGYFVAASESRRIALTRFARQTGLAFEVDPDVNFETKISFLATKSTVGETIKQIIGPENRIEVDDWRFRIRRH